MNSINLTENEKEQIKQVVSEKLDLDLNKIEDNSIILNSLTSKHDRSELILELEERFDITIFEYEIEKVSTLGQLFDCLTTIFNE